MRWVHRVAAAVAVASGVIAAACSNSSAVAPGPSGATNGPCTTDSDCAAGYACGYNVDENTCSSSTGACVQLGSASSAPACGCNGLPVDYVAPGYVEGPAASAQPCDAGSPGAEAGGGDSGAAPDGSSADAAPLEDGGVHASDGASGDDSAAAGQDAAVDGSDASLLDSALPDDASNDADAGEKGDS